MRLKPRLSLRTHFLHLGQSGCMSSYLGGMISIQYFHLFYFIFALEPGSHSEVLTTYYIA